MNIQDKEVQNMSGTLTYDERYNDWFNKVMPEMQENIEGEILTR